MAERILLGEEPGVNPGSSRAGARSREFMAVNARIPRNVWEVLRYTEETRMLVSEGLMPL